MFNLHPLIHELLEQPLPVSAAMQKLIDGHERARPDGDWSPFRTLPFDADIERLTNEWFPEVISDEPPARLPVKALYFGLFQPTIKRKTVADFYLAGSLTYDEDGDGDWAVGPAYFPSKRYANSTVLAEIYRLAYRKGGLENDAEESLCLGFTAFAAKQLLSAADPSMIALEGTRIGIAAGWDSGGPLYLGWYARNGFTPREASAAIAGIEKQEEDARARFRRMGIDLPDD